MKLTTDIKPRQEGTVVAEIGDGKQYTFEPDAEGRLVAEVDDDTHVGYLLDSGNFYPADESDNEAGIESLNSTQEAASGNPGPDAPKKKGGKKK